MVLKVDLFFIMILEKYSACLISLSMCGHFHILQEQINRMSYNEKSDIWSLGCLLYELCALSWVTLPVIYILTQYPPVNALD